MAKINENTIMRIVNESVRSVLSDYENRESNKQEALKESVLSELRLYLYEMISGESFTFPGEDNNGTVTTKLYWEPEELEMLKHFYSSIEKLVIKYQREL